MRMYHTIMLIFLTIFLLIITAGFWAGIPLFVLSEFLYQTRLSGFVPFPLTSLRVGVCFSIVCIPLHLSIAARKEQATLHAFWQIQGISILLAGLLFGLFY